MATEYKDLKAMMALARLHQVLDEAEADLSATLGVPLCVEKCGLCCHVPSVRVLEAALIASTILGTPDRVPVVLDKCVEWLTAPGKVGTPKKPLSQPELIQEAMRISTQPCPFLSQEKCCLVYDARPIICRAMGLTRAVPGCKRPVGLGERGSHRLVAGAAVNNAIRKVFRETLAMGSPEASNYGFLPTLLYQRFSGSQLAALAYNGRVSTVKLLMGSGVPADAETGGFIQDESLDVVDKSNIPLVESGRGLVQRTKGIQL